MLEVAGEAKLESSYTKAVLCVWMYLRLSSSLNEIRIILIINFCETQQGNEDDLFRRLLETLLGLKIKIRSFRAASKEQ